MNKKKLRIARNKIDQLDKKIFYLIKKRTKIVKFMLSLKGFKKQIVDYKRINEILKNIRIFIFFSHKINIHIYKIE